MPSKVVAEAGGTKLALYQGHMRFSSKPLSPASQGLCLEPHLGSADCSATLALAGVVEKLSWEVRPAKGAPPLDSQPKAKSKESVDRNRDSKEMD